MTKFGYTLMTEQSGPKQLVGYAVSSYQSGGLDGWIAQALQVMGLPQNLAPGVKRIIMNESGGNPNAISPTDDFGLWQINGSHGSMATLNPAGNARSAVSISDNGRNWGPWTTYTSGAYRGKC